MSDSILANNTQHFRLDRDRLRDRKQRQKWHLGEANPNDGHPSKRPNKPVGQAFSRLRKREANFQDNKAAKMGRMSRKHRASPALRPDHEDALAEHDADVEQAFQGSAEEAAYTYSYDRAQGATKGSQILGQAVAQAVDKFENTATEKLVREEYELVSAEEDFTTGSSAGEDDFELL